MATIDKGCARPTTCQAQRSGVEQDETRHDLAHPFEELATGRTVLVDSTYQALQRIGWILVRQAAQCRQGAQNRLVASPSLRGRERNEPALLVHGAWGKLRYQSLGVSQDLGGLRPVDERILA